MRFTAPSCLRALSNPAGVACVLALDHRDALRNAYVRAGVPDVTEQTMLDTKSRIAEALAKGASAIMLDPAAVERCRPADTGLIVPLEAQGHDAFAGGRLTRLAEDFGPSDAKELGADACKLLLYYRPDHVDTATKQRELLAETVAHCQRYGTPLVLEPLVYRLDGEDEVEYGDAFPELVVAATRDLASSGADLLKLQFPGDARSCERMTKAAGSIRWTLLGGNDLDGNAFLGHLRLACRAGASGFMAGRTIWGGALTMPEGDQLKWLQSEAVPLFDQLSYIAHEHARRI